MVQTQVQQIKDKKREDVNFVAKSVRIKNRKNNDYFLYRLTIPKKVVTDLDLKGSEFLLINLRKAKWYHMIDWTKTDKAWDMLADNLKGEIVSLGLDNPLSSTARTIPISSQTEKSIVYNYGNSASLAQKVNIDSSNSSSI
jgi:hypothetical protein